MSDTPERLTDDQLAYHRAVIDQQNGAQAIAVHWSQYLSATYRLRQGDTIALDGRIVRAEEPRQ